MTTDTTANTRTVAGDLKPGQSVWLNGDIREVRHVEPYTANGAKFCLVVLAGGRPLDISADAPVPLATPQEIAEAEVADRRAAVAKALRDLAKAITDYALPVPRYTLHLSGCVESRGDLDKWAKHLGREIEAGGTEGTIPVTDAEIPTGVDGLALHVRLQAPMEPAAEVETPDEPATVDVSDEDHEAREDFQTMGADEDREPLTVETSEDSAAIVDANLRAMGSTGLGPAPVAAAPSPSTLNRSLIAEVRGRGLWPGQVRIGPDLDFGQAARA